MATSEHKRAAMRAYSQTPAGQQAKARSHERYIEKRRALREMNRPMQINPGPLERALKEWSK
jgi:hypothetical protein